MTAMINNKKDDIHKRILGFYYFMVSEKIAGRN
jgi:hypothetical protein